MVSQGVLEINTCLLFRSDLPQARRDFYEAERNLQQFRKTQSLVY